MATYTAFNDKLGAAVAANNSVLCVGLDPYLNQLPPCLKAEIDPLFTFNKAIIDATADLVSSFKLNSAMYEADGAHGITQLQQTCAYLTQNYPDLPILLDAKRADIGNTNNGYISYAFDYLGTDAVTVQPYLGREAVEPFLDQADKGIIVLCRTSNPGAGEFQDLVVDGKPLYQHVAMQVATEWNANNNCLLVIGATYPDEIAAVRAIVGPDMWFLIPGIGAQGGNVQKTMQAGGDHVIINSSRGIIYASTGDDYAEAARRESQKLRDEINKHRS